MKRILVITLSLIPTLCFCQSLYSVDQLVQEALKNNPQIKSAQAEIDSKKAMQKSSFDLPKTEVTLLYGQYNSYASNDNNIAVSQTIPFSSLGSLGSLNRALVASSEIQKSVTENELAYRVKQLYYNLALAKALHNLLLMQDSLYERFFQSSALRYTTG